MPKHFSLKELCVVFAIIQFVVSQQPSVPTLPRSFATDYSISIDLLNGDYPLVEGHFAIDYDGLGGMIYFEDSPRGGVPWVIQTSVIGHPVPALQESLGFEYLSEGRCWIIGELPQDYFHYAPLAIPPDALFLGNSTVNGDVCSQWTWTATLDSLIPLKFILFVRYMDNAPLIFVIENSFFLVFRVTITNSRFFLNPSKSYFNIPPGPCANKSWNFDTPRTPKESVNGFEAISKYFMKKLLPALKTKSAFASILEGTLQVNNLVQKRSSDPTPPVLHQYFQSDYEIGYGELEESKGWKPPNSLFRGNMAVDKETGGFYLNINDNQVSDVPFLFSTNFIVNPTSSQLSGYWFLHPGRCWKTEGNIVNPDFPLQIPANATFLGSKTIYGEAATLWQFDGSYEGYDGQFQIAVSSVDNSIIFITIDPDFESLPLGTYLIFSNFNSSKPDPATYAVPPGHCWDPLVQGPGN